MTFFANFKKSALELKNLRSICVIAILIALDLVLKTFLNVQITDDLKLSFAFVAVAAIGMLYGPTAAGLACLVTDVLGYVLKPSGGSFSPLFTVIEVMGGVIYGCMLYNFNPIKLDFSGGEKFRKSLLENWRAVLRIVLAKVLVAVICNLIMTPFAITVQRTLEAGVYNADVFWVGLWTRINTRLIKNAIEAPIHIAILMFALFPIKAAYNSVFKQNKSAVLHRKEKNSGT